MEVYVFLSYHITTVSLCVRIVCGKGQPLVLTPEEFATLTQQSLGKPAIELTIPKVPRQSNGTVAKPINLATPMNSVSTTILHETSDVSLLKAHSSLWL